MADTKTFYAKAINDGKFSRVTDKPNDETIFEITDNGGQMTFGIYKGAEQLVCKHPEFLDGCDKQVLSDKGVHVREPGVVRKDGGEWNIVKPPKLLLASEEELEIFNKPKEVDYQTQLQTLYGTEPEFQDFFKGKNIKTKADFDKIVKEYGAHKKTLSTQIGDKKAPDIHSDLIIEAIPSPVVKENIATQSGEDPVITPKEPEKQPTGKPNNDNQDIPVIVENNIDSQEKNENPIVNLSENPVIVNEDWKERRKSILSEYAAAHNHGDVSEDAAQTPAGGQSLTMKNTQWRSPSENILQIGVEGENTEVNIFQAAVTVAKKEGKRVSFSPNSSEEFNVQLMIECMKQGVNTNPDTKPDWSKVSPEIQNKYKDAYAAAEKMDKIRPKTDEEKHLREVRDRAKGGDKAAKLELYERRNKTMTKEYKAGAGHQAFQKNLSKLKGHSNE